MEVMDSFGSLMAGIQNEVVSDFHSAVESVAQDVSSGGGAGSMVKSG